MDGLITLLSLCTVMAVGSFAAGILPLSLKLSASSLRLISTIGMGVLVGTSMIVIIPEGVETLYSSNNAGHGHEKRSLRYGAHTRWSTGSESMPILSSRQADTFGLDTPGPVMIPDAAAPPLTPTDPGVVGILDSGSSSEHDDDHEPAHHAWIGVALISGFILMFLIDKTPQYTSPSKPRSTTHHIALNNLGGRFNLTTRDHADEEDSEPFLSDSSTTSPSASSATTIGLVIHAAADGIALGASSSTSNTGLSLVIFFAIMVHKAPAAFGLTSVLLKQGLSKRAARAHLVIFSLAAPAGAFLTWMLVRLLGGNSAVARSAQNSQWWTGVLLLFSAGTFLYVAMHAMQQVTAVPHDTATENHVNGSIDAPRNDQQQVQPSVKDLGAAVFGMILPLFLQIGHAH